MSYDTSGSGIGPIGSYQPAEPPRPHHQNPNAENYFLGAHHRQNRNRPHRQAVTAASHGDGVPHHYVRCPNHRCNKAVSLRCPDCATGYLQGDSEGVLLVCDNCNHIEHDVRCHCGTVIRARYICDQLHHIRELELAADGTLFFMLAVMALGAMGLLWIIVA